MKDIKKLEARKQSLLNKEARNSFSKYSENEEIKSTNEYSYLDTRKEVNAIDSRIRHLKYLLSKNNIETIIDSFNMSLTEGLIYLSQLTKEKSVISLLASKDKITRTSNNYSALVEYTTLNYDLTKVKEDLEEIENKISSLQIAIDRANLTNEIEVD